jgi:hypothetical protein
MGVQVMARSGHNIVGHAAEVVITDPWDFMTEVGTQPLPGRVDSYEESGGWINRIVVDLLIPVTYQGQRIARIYATPRHKDSPNAQAILGGVGLPANMEGSSTNTAEHRPVAFVGEIRVQSVGSTKEVPAY